MPRFTFPKNASFHTARTFFAGHTPFVLDGGPAILSFPPTFPYIEPVALSMAAAWGTWCKKNGLAINVENMGRNASYASRMHLFKHLGINDAPDVREREEAGRFLPITQIKDRTDITAVIGDISALLHLNDEPDALAAVQYCVSELLRNVIEHAGTEDGAFVCAHRYANNNLHRVTLAVADCGRGVASHLGQKYNEALDNDRIALGLAMTPGITGAQVGLYGTTENAGAGLFITRSIAKGTGGYFLMSTGNAVYRLRRSNDPDKQLSLFADPYTEQRHDGWEFDSSWQGTIASVEIRMNKIEDFQEFFSWIRKHMPQRKGVGFGIKFT